MAAFLLSVFKWRVNENVLRKGGQDYKAFLSTFEMVTKNHLLPAKTLTLRAREKVPAEVHYFMTDN